ncbi:MAG: universal stress protein [Bacteroidota bacterium]
MTRTKRILVPISFSPFSDNSLRHVANMFEGEELTLLHVYPEKEYNRKFDFGKRSYAVGMHEELKKTFRRVVGEPPAKTCFLAHAGTISRTINKISHRYDLMVLSRKIHPVKKYEYFSSKKLFIITKARCPVLILPITDAPFRLQNCEHVWHIKRRDTEPVVVAKGMEKLGVDPERMEVKTLQQRNFLSSFWKNIIAYENSHKKNLLKKIDEAHEKESIDLIILVDNEASIFSDFFKGEIVRQFNDHKIPILVLPDQF